MRGHWKCNAGSVGRMPLLARRFATIAGSPSKPRRRARAIMPPAVVAVAIGLVPLLSGHGRDVGEGYEITYKGISSDPSELTAYLDGTAKNTTGGFADMDLLYYFHDADGEVIGIGIVRLEDVAPGESRGFSAPILPIDDRLSYSDPDGAKAKCKTWELIPPVVSN